MNTRQDKTSIPRAREAFSCLFLSCRGAKTFFKTGIDKSEGWWYNLLNKADGARHARIQARKRRLCRRTFGRRGAALSADLREMRGGSVGGLSGGEGRLCRDRCPRKRAPADAEMLGRCPTVYAFNPSTNRQAARAATAPSAVAVVTWRTALVRQSPATNTPGRVVVGRQDSSAAT